MTGHIFHPGHEDLHGVTVVVESPSGMTWVGRYHECTERGVLLHDVASYDPGATDQPRSAWIQRQIKFGVRADLRHFVVPNDQASRIVRLMEWESPAS